MKKVEITVKGNDEAVIKRRISAIVVAATVFVMALLGVLVYQWVKLGVQGGRIKEAMAEKTALEQQISDRTQDLTDIQEDDYLKYDYWLKYENAQNK